MAKSLFSLLKEGSTTPTFNITTEGFFVNGTLLFSDIIFHQEIIDPPSLPAGDNASISVTIPGSVLGDFVLSASGTDIQDTTVAAHVIAPDTITLNIDNPTGGTIDLPSSTWNFIIFKR